MNAVSVMGLTKFDIWKAVLIILALNIILPTADVTTDIMFIASLYKGVTLCNHSTEGIKIDEEEYKKCEEGPDKYCSELRSPGLCELDLYDFHFICKDISEWSAEYQDYEQCQYEVGYSSYCSDPASNKNVCEGAGQHTSHPIMATMVLMPCILNYIVCFITFFRLETDLKKTFIFPLLNIYPQFGN